MKKSILISTALGTLLSVNLLTTAVSAASLSPSSLPEATSLKLQSFGEYSNFEMTTFPYYNTLVTTTPVANNVVNNKISDETTEIVLDITKSIFNNSDQAWVVLYPTYGGVETFPIDKSTGTAVINPSAPGFLPSDALNYVSVRTDNGIERQIFSFSVG